MNINIKKDEDFYGLDDDKEFAQKYFITKTNNNEGDTTLVPQFWWGNLKENSIIILGKNPSYRSELNKINNKSDDNDNKTNSETRKYLEDNITRNNGFKSNFFDEISNSYITYWWKEKFFKGYEIENLKDRIAILNLFGYYSNNSDYLNKITEDELKKSHIYKYKNEISNLLEKATAIIFLWQGSEKIWNKVLSSDGNDNFFDKECIRNKLYFANYKKGLNPKFVDIISYKDREEIDEMSINNIESIIANLKE